MKLLGTVFAAVTMAAAADDVPQWVSEAAARKPPAYPVKVTSVVLVQEEHLTVDAEGRRTFRERGAIRVLQPGGKHSAYRPYNARSGRIRDFQGWVVPAVGKPVALGRSAVVDVALSTDEAYGEGRARVLDPGSQLAPESVFAWEIVEEEKTIFTQYHYSFQDSMPVLTSRFVLSLPAGWEVSVKVWNHAAFEPQVAGSTWTWETRDLPWLEAEEHSPGAHALAPRLAVSYYPSSGANPALRPLKDWTAVSTWLSGFYDAASELTPAIRQKAAELTRNAAAELDRIRAIAAFAQQTNYVSVQMNLTRGGGYMPNRASDVLGRNYGDCKDKAALMRALLGGVGIESWPVAIYSGDRGFVRPEWPSTLQFNHAIVAVRVSPETKLAAVLDHPRLGRLLFFDPTDPDTPLGDLPEDEQGSHALVLAGAKGELIQAPLAPASASRVESRIEAKFSPEGGLTAHVTRQYFGQPAARMRSLSRQHKDDLKRSFELGLSRRLGGLSLTGVIPTDRMQEGRLQLELDFAVRQFGQMMQERLLVLEPGALLPAAGYGFPAKPRRWPVRLAASARSDTVSIEVPAQFKPDEVPEPVKLESRWGKYTANWSVKDGKVTFQHSFEVQDTLAPASDYEAIREFFERMAGAQHSAVVLVK